MGIFRRKPKQEFVLGDAELLHQEHPETFLIPRRAERDALRPGDLVKLMFELLEPSGDDGTAERMWVRVDKAEAGRYVGTLDNEPILLESIVLGDRVEFGPEHVLALWEDDPAEGEPVVMVFRRSIEEGLRPRVAHRVEPVEPRDSGWRLLVGDETDDDLDDPANALLRPVAEVCGRWPELQPMIDAAEVDTDWAWDDATGAYVPEPDEE